MVMKNIIHKGIFIYELFINDTNIIIEIKSILFNKHAIYPTI